MSNVLEYTLSLNDKLSAKLQKIGVSNNMQLQTWAKVQTQINASKTSMSQMGVSIGSLNERIAALRAQREWIPAKNREAIRASNLEIKKLENQMRSLENLNGSRVKKWFSELKSSVPALQMLTNPLVLLGAGFYKLNQLVGASSEAYKVKAVQETKLGQVMHNTMDARQQDIKSVLDLVAAQEKLGVVDGVTQTAGMQELSTYLTKTQSIDKLLPVMNDMLVQQYGLNATQEQAVQLGSMLGKVMDGQTGALSRYGYKFSEAQEKILKTGSEAQRAATLFDVVNDSVGGMNKAMAQTPEGKIKQLQNQAGGLQENLGKLINAFKTSFTGIYERFMELLSRVISLLERHKEKIMNAFRVIAWAAEKAFGSVVAVMGWVVNGLSDFFQQLNAGHPVFVGITAVIAGMTTAVVLLKTYALLASAATSIWTAAKWALNAALTASPIGLIIAGIVTLIAAIGYVIYKTDGWGKAWQHTVAGAKLLWEGFTESAKYYFNTMVNELIIGLNLIKKGWYELKESLGIGDSNQNQSILAKIHTDTEARKNAITQGAQKIKELAQASANEFMAAGNSLSWNSERKLSEMTSGLMNSLGIAPPKMAGIGSGGYGSGDNTIGSDQGTKTNTAIATGGTKNNYITINLKDLIGVINIQGKNFKETTDDMADETTDALLRVLAMAETAAG